MPSAGDILYHMCNDVTCPAIASEVTTMDMRILLLLLILLHTEILLHTVRHVSLCLQQLMSSCLLCDAITRTMTHTVPLRATIPAHPRRV